MSMARLPQAGADAPRASSLPPRIALGIVREAIDRVDDAMVLLLAVRRRLVAGAGRLKQAAGVPPRDPRREREVRWRAQRIGNRVGVPEGTARALLDVLISDACRQQGLAADLGQGGSHVGRAIIAPMTTSLLLDEGAGPHAWLRLLPPPRRIAPLLRMVPARWPGRLVESLVARVLAQPLAHGDLDFMHGRRLGIEVADLGLRWVLEVDGTRLRTTDGPAEATVRGSAADLLLLAGRLEDADTLFFQRALVLTGDTELGLTARNLLERLPWEAIPLGLRIALNRGARIARAARTAHRAGAR